MTVDLAMLLRVGGVLDLTTLPEFIRRLFWAYYGFIALCLISFSVISFAFADTLAAGSSLARAVCAFFAVFWTLRLLVATFVFGPAAVPDEHVASHRFSRHEHRVLVPAGRVRIGRQPSSLDRLGHELSGPRIPDPVAPGARRRAAIWPSRLRKLEQYRHRRT